ncbi:MAG: futalosine hydrolase [Phycisphaerales bacterium]|nr:futalosine hydrolase [Phycisphaerales bacterium]
MLLLATAVQAEADAIGGIDGTHVLVTGPGRTNAAAAVTEVVVRNPGKFTAVVSVGVAGVLPGSALTLGDVVHASRCVYMEEGLITPGGFQTMSDLGFPLGEFDGNVLCPDDTLAYRCGLPGVPIATVATCSGTDNAAQGVADRTGCDVEAMEGAAVLHAARRLGMPAIEIRSISNTTGDRDTQQWDLPGALTALGWAMVDVCAACRR